MVRTVFGPSLRGEQLKAYRDSLRRGPIALTDEAALLETREIALLQQFSASAPAWHEVSELTSQLTANLASLREEMPAVSGLSSGRRLQETIGAIVDVVSKGADSERTWRQILRAIDLKRKVVNVEARRQRQAADLVTRPQVISIMAYLGQLVA
jgi:hypothetical protein